MSDPFAEMVDEVHAEPGFALPALYRVLGQGAGIAVSLRRVRPDVTIEYRGLDLAAATDGVFVRSAQVADLRKGDTFALLDAAGQPTGIVLEALEDGRRDADGLEWFAGIVTQ